MAARLVILFGIPRRRVGAALVTWSIIFLTSFAAVACIPLFRAVEVEEVDPDQAISGAGFGTPVRAYLSDGSIVVLPGGGRVAEGALEGSGYRYGITLADSVPFSAISTDSIVGVEVFRGEYVNEAGTVLLTAASAAAAVAGTALMAVAIFGSCPTVYADVDGQQAIQMEAFSYSIAPLFESRDVAALSTSGDGSGRISLELRNEALETHYINHLELLRVFHGPQERALPDPTGRPILIGKGRPPFAARDRDGRDVIEALMRTDEKVFRSSRSRLSSASAQDFADHLDLLVPVPDGEDEITLVIRMRNTLLNSVLFYDVILADSGVGALEWLGSKMDRIGDALEMGSWYQERMGMRILVGRGSQWYEVEHLADVGPISWKEVAVPIRVLRETDYARIRLEFVTDSWFIDRVEVAGPSRRPQVASVTPSRVLRTDGSADDHARTALLSPDTDYFVTFPGQRFKIEFEAPSASTRPFTLLLGAQGYYVEWVRGPWLKDPRSHEAFEPSDRELLRALQRWDDVRDDFERDFHATRIPAR